MSLDKEIFKGKTLSDLFGEIHDNSTSTRAQVKALIGETGEMFDFSELQDLLEESEESKEEIENIDEKKEEDE